MQLIDKEKVEEILRNLWKKDDGHNSEHRICYNKALQEFQCEIDTLEVKNVDLEKEIDNYIDTKEVWEIQEAPLTSIENAAIHFFELGMAVSNKQIKEKK